MLDTDMCLAFTLQAGEDLSAQSGGCCAWRFVDDSDQIDSDNGFCGFVHSSSFGIEQGWCCNNLPDCGSARHPEGKAFPAIREWTTNENAWLQTFIQAWHKATENGFTDLKPLTVTPTPAPPPASCPWWCGLQTCFK